MFTLCLLPGLFNKYLYFKFQGHFIEVQVSEGALYRTKIHCYFLDQSRVIRPQPTEKNYHIFYQLMAGLTGPERRQLGLAGYTIRDLRYTNRYLR